MSDFPGDFLIGSATAAHQVEGGLDNDWTRMERNEPQRIKNRDSASVAIDHYHRYREDLQLLAALHHRAYRFSVEWARVEPREGDFDYSALRHYADVVRTCRELNIEPIVTLHHFTLPVWVADQGGLLWHETPRLFARYAAVMAEVLRDVKWWVTVNEPNVLALYAYGNGEWPPHHQWFPEVLRAQQTMLRMHAAACTALRSQAHRTGRVMKISLAVHLRPLRPKAGVLNRVSGILPDYMFNWLTLQCCISGRLLPPAGVGQKIPGLQNSLDYLALNYYCEVESSFDWRQPQMFFVGQHNPAGLPVSTFDWPIDPEGLRRGLQELHDEFHLPILITENGVADNDDELRAEYIVSHLRAVANAIHDGVDVLGYIYWTSFDNFEWLEGYSQKFGLFSVDRQTLERRPKPSADVFSRICQTLTLPA